MAAASTLLPFIDLPDCVRELGVLEGGSAGRKIALPLSSVEISAQVADRVATVTLKQVFRNTLTEHMEAVYIFPLSAGCAVSKFTMITGDRRVDGIVRERSEARQEYQQALTQGNRAALIEQERDDVFTVQVGNVPPGEEATVEITYSERLPFYENGKTELRLPLVVSPRYIPGAALNREQTGAGVEADTNLVPDASRITPPRMAEGSQSDVKLTVNVDIYPGEAGAELSDLECSQHATRMALKPGAIRISLANQTERLNRDFVLRWMMGGEEIKSSILTYQDANGDTYAVLSVVPPAKPGYKGAPRDIIFLVDRSGSMEGIKMGSATRACSILLNTLGPKDRFAIMAFDDRIDWMPENMNGRNMLDATEAGIERGEKFLRTLTSRGGTEIHMAMQAACAASNASLDGRKAAIVVITDGEVGNESQVLQLIQRTLGDTRLFAVGIDTAVNAGLLKRMANLGGGTAALVEPGIQLEEALTSIGREIGHPLVTDMQVDGLELSIDRASISPSRIPDVFAQRASIVFFKLNGTGKVRVTGKLPNGKNFEVKVAPKATEVPAVAQLWAKARIVELEDQFRISSNNKPALKSQIIEVAVKHSLLTKFTAIVAVDTEVVNEGGQQRQLVQPVEMPDKWEMQADGSPKLAQSTPPQQLFGSSRLRSQQSSPQRSASRGAPTQSAWGPAPASPPAPGSNAGWGSSAPAAQDGWAAPGEADAGWGVGAPAQSGGWSAGAQTDSDETAEGQWAAPAPGGTRGASLHDEWGATACDAKASEPAPEAQQSGWGDLNSIPSTAPKKQQLGGSFAKKKEVNIQYSKSDLTSLSKSIAREESDAEAPTEPDAYGLASLGKILDKAEASAPAPASQPAPSPSPTPPSAPKPASRAMNTGEHEQFESFPRLNKQERVDESRANQPFGRASGSYGSGTRAQVFEVIVRQAIAGADWKSICMGPMQVNSITPEEVQAEVDRRAATAPPKQPPQPQPPQPPKQPPTGGLLDRFNELKDSIFGGNKDKEQTAESFQRAKNLPVTPRQVAKAVRVFFQLFTAAFALVSEGRRPSADEMETARKELIKYLATAPDSADMPILQRFVRSQAIELIGALRDPGTSQDELKEFFSSMHPQFESAKNEVEKKLASPRGAGPGAPAAFWEDSV